jgi:hypothetical protein
VGGGVQEAPLLYTGEYGKAYGYADVRIAEIKPSAITDARYVYEKYGSVVSIGKKQAGKVIAFNASYVQTSSGTILGKTIDEAKVVFPEVEGKTENRKHLYYDGGRFHIGKLSADLPVFAAQAGPQLTLEGNAYLNESLAEDVFQSDITNGSNNRIMAGVKEDGTLVLIMVDGRGNYDKGFTLKEMEVLALHFGCYDSINLDGGGSVTLYTNIPALQDKLDMDDEYHLSDMGAFFPRKVSHAVVLYVDEDELFREPVDNKTTIQFTLNSPIVYVNGEVKEVIVAPEVVNGRTIIGVRDMANLLGAELALDGNIITLTIDE